jgi:hypothetical protein
VLSYRESDFFDTSYDWLAVAYVHCNEITPSSCASLVAHLALSYVYCYDISIALTGGQLTRNDIHLHTKRAKLARKTIDTNLLLQALV